MLLQFWLDFTWHVVWLGEQDQPQTLLSHEWHLCRKVEALEKLNDG
jgi:hypothetical protein